MLFFVNVDFSDTDVQDQMDDFINDMVDMEYVSNQPKQCWLRDFQKFVSNSTSISRQPFNAQIDMFLDDANYYKMYHKHLEFLENGTLIESRCQVEFDQLKVGDVKGQIDALAQQDTISRAQPINNGLDDNLHFFTHAPQYGEYAFYSVCVSELIGNTIVEVSLVTLVAFLLIPHWSAALFVCPIVIMMYMDILGALQLAGVAVNAVSCVCLIMSIGLIVDYLMHVLLRYYETSGTTSRFKIVDTIGTMGMSVLAGGCSTFLGTLALAFSSTDIFWIIFVTFTSIVVVGITHGLILLPVL
jgi:predicted RND superfamily exporter protein